MSGNSICKSTGGLPEVNPLGGANSSDNENNGDNKDLPNKIKKTNSTTFSLFDEIQDQVNKNKEVNNSYYSSHKRETSETLQLKNNNNLIITTSNSNKNNQASLVPPPKFSQLSLPYSNTDEIKNENNGASVSPRQGQDEEKELNVSQGKESKTNQKDYSEFQSTLDVALKKTKNAKEQKTPEVLKLLNQGLTFFSEEMKAFNSENPNASSSKINKHAEKIFNEILGGDNVKSIVKLWTELSSSSEKHKGGFLFPEKDRKKGVALGQLAEQMQSFVSASNMLKKYNQSMSASNKPVNQQKNEPPLVTEDTKGHINNNHHHNRVATYTGTRLPKPNEFNPTNVGGRCMTMVNPEDLNKTIGQLNKLNNKDDDKKNTDLRSQLEDSFPKEKERKASRPSIANKSKEQTKTFMYQNNMIDNNKLSKLELSTTKLLSTKTNNANVEDEDEIEDNYAPFYLQHKIKTSIKNTTTEDFKNEMNNITKSADGFMDKMLNEMQIEINNNNQKDK